MDGPSGVATDAAEATPMARRTGAGGKAGGGTLKIAVMARS